MRTPCTVFVVALALVACSGPAGTDGGTADGGATDAGSTGCALTASTTASSNVAAAGCAVLDRDTTACSAARTAAGLSGVYLKFSCRVTLTKETLAGADVVKAVSDGQPDHLSNYFATANACHETYTGAIQNPNTIAAKSYAVNFPLVPDTATQSMTGAVVGLSLNGVPIFANFAAPGDDIFKEALTFDRCGGHPQMAGAYHYHGEPYALSNDDARLIGVLRDGYPVYGRRDRDSTLPTLDANGGHSAVTDDSAGASVYHYHLNEQTSTTAGTAGQKQWFLTKGSYRGAPASCTTCN